MAMRTFLFELDDELNMGCSKSLKTVSEKIAISCMQNRRLLT
ncbi:hypothetical protein J588_0589 [Acinetobacter sp. 1578804]|nr:hypothetical protein J588_0589 [Acinetobacter sp. 1578804]EXG29505.1 hypothetical protein J733_3488 [Acinetobacter sp. 263903-2]EYT44873.1 hypothetical protein J619_02725 [Acinetobacter sp. 478810]